MRPLEADDPRWIGSWELLGRLGSGGMGEVFLGRSGAGQPGDGRFGAGRPGDGRLAAVKAARPEFAQDAEFRRRFAREVEAARRVDGRFTAAVLEADPGAPRPWLATEYIPGVSVTEAVAQRGPLPEVSLRALAAGMAAALEAIHRAGITHRDLKPSNVLLADDGPRVIDFGIARSGDHTQLTVTGQFPGTPGYMAPEQLSGAPVGPATDVYALGATLVFAATGQGPYGQGELLAMIYRTMEHEPQLDGVPAGLRPTLARCLAKDPAQRPTVAALRAEFSVGSTLGHGQWLPAELGTLVMRRRTAGFGPAPTATAYAVPGAAPTPPAGVPSAPPGPAPVLGGPLAPVLGGPPAPVRGRPTRRSVLAAGVAGIAAAGGGTALVLRNLGEETGGATGAGPGPARSGSGQAEPPDSPSPEDGTDASPEASPEAGSDAGSSPSAGSGSGSSEAASPAAADPSGFPVITAGTGFGEKPTLARATGTPPSELVVRTLIQGSGATVATGDDLTCHYVIQVWDTGLILDSSYDHGFPLTFQAGTGQVIKGLDQAIVGKRAGSRLQISVPPALAFGEKGMDKVKGTDTVVYVVDLLSARHG